jgi:hypothetical protein
LIRKVRAKFAEPENIMLGKHGETLVVDWRLAQFVERDPRAKAGGEETRMPEMLDKANKGVETGMRLVCLPALSGVSFVTNCIAWSEFGMLEEPSDTPRRRSTMEGGRSL